MPRTIEAIVENDGSLRLLEEIELRPGERAFIMILDKEPDSSETTLLSEAALASDWNRDEEDEAWAHLQP